MKLTVFVAALALLSTQAQAHSYFTATASADGSPATAIATLFEHAGNVEWSLNATDIAPGPLTVSIVDGNPETSVAPVVLLWSGEAEGADFEAAGEFNASDLAPTSMSVTIDDLKGHMGMGHIYLEVASGETKLYGAFAQTAEDGGPLEEAGMGHGMAPGAAPMEDHAGHDEPVAEAADGHDHAADEHAGHSHRRMLA